MAHVDATGADALRHLDADPEGDSIDLVVARMKPRVYERLGAAGVHEAIGMDRFHPTVRAAVAACLEKDNGSSGP